ncbi:interleukin-10 receptor subunit beta-like [Brienomyrus brachyistius]|uniref:interleukin-10 receptor subunit beta-like n=1 Tax=Brienomyrus brachyistius TaxID=42636 RepID=UPI0020B3C1B7|nr:interleukin-10 receptor subunit beta-like [Brienomyrus brachyistius]
MRSIFSSQGCFFSVLYSLSVVLAAVPEPENVTVMSYNMGAVLEWDYPHNASEGVRYTAEFKSHLLEYVAACQSQQERKCDFTNNTHYFGIYTFRVRAELQGSTSSWVNTTEFFLDRQTIIGPPVVSLHSKAGDMEVNLQDPVLKMSTLKDVYTDIIYNLSYWKEGQEETKKQKQTKQKLLLLSELLPWTRYCVQADIYIPGYSKLSEQSEPVCETTTSNGTVKPWVVAVALISSFLVTTVSLPLLFLLGWYCYKGLRFLYPSAKLPEHFKQYLIEPYRSYIFLAMQNSAEENEPYHAVVIVSDGSGEQADAPAEPSEKLQAMEENQVHSEEDKDEKDKDQLLQPS